MPRAVRRFVDGHVRMGISTHLKEVDNGFQKIAAVPALAAKPIVIGESDPEGCAACPGPQNAYRNGTMYSSYTAASFARIWELAREARRESRRRAVLGVRVRESALVRGLSAAVDQRRQSAGAQCIPHVRAARARAHRRRRAARRFRSSRSWRKVCAARPMWAYWRRALRKATSRCWSGTTTTMICRVRRGGAPDYHRPQAGERRPSGVSMSARQCLRRVESHGSAAVAECLPIRAAREGIRARSESLPLQPWRRGSVQLDVNVPRQGVALVVLE